MQWNGYVNKYHILIMNRPAKQQKLPQATMQYLYEVWFT